jgi:hypothetical protein
VGSARDSAHCPCGVLPSAIEWQSWAYASTRPVLSTIAVPPRGASDAVVPKHLELGLRLGTDGDLPGRPDLYSLG